MSPFTSTPLLIRADEARVVVSAPGAGPGNWAGAASAFADDGLVYLAYRVRRPLLDGRGVCVVVARSSDGVVFEQVSEVHRHQFRAESFNLSNTPHFANPNGNANSSTFGRITSTQSAADAIGRSRELRFGLRLGF